MGENHTSQSRSEFDWYNPTYKKIHVKAKLFIQAFMHLCLVRLRLLCGRQKTGESKIFLYFLWYVDMGEDYSSQSQSEFHWYIPHLYNYLHLLFYNTAVFFQSQLNVKVQV